MEKVVNIDGMETRMVANAATPRLYRSMFGKDVFADMTHAIGDDGTINSAECFENLAFTMARQGGLTEDIDTWLGGFENPTAIIEAVPEIMNLWLGTQTTTVEGKKK